MNEDDAKAEWLHNAVGPPERRNTTDIWSCGCSMSEYGTDLEGGNRAYMFTSLCREHQEAYENDTS